MSGTRVDLLHQLCEWGAIHAKPVLWLSGMAGTGKSTISRTLAEKFSESNTLGGTFFFSRGSGEANNAAKFVTTLASQLARMSHSTREMICDALATNGDVLRQGIRNQWKRLVIDPLSKADCSSRKSVNFVVDALDECGSEDDIRLLLQLFIEVQGVLNVNLGVFVTSRPELAIRLGFQQMPEILHQDLDLRDIPRETVKQDLSVFLG